MAAKFDRSRGWVPSKDLIREPIIREQMAATIVELLKVWDIVTFNTDGDLVALAIAGTMVATYEVSYWVDGNHIRISPVGQEELCVWSGEIGPLKLSTIDEIREFVTQKIRETL